MNISSLIAGLGLLTGRKTRPTMTAGNFAKPSSDRRALASEIPFLVSLPIQKTYKLGNFLAGHVRSQDRMEARGILMKVKVEISGWEKLNARKDQQTYTWFRCENNMPVSQSLFGMTAGERFVWITLLCLCSQKQSGDLEFETEWLSWYSGATLEEVEGALEKLEASHTIVYARNKPTYTRVRKPKVTSDSRALQTDIQTDNTDIQTDTLSETETVPALVVGEVSTEKEKKPGVLVWEAYSTAFKKRWGDDPPRNAESNSLCKRLAEKLGVTEAPQVASFYLEHKDAFYVKMMHPLSFLVRDATRVRTEWATGNVTTQFGAKQGELQQHNRQVMRNYLAREKTE
jgi:hypothetical protein